PIEIVWTSGATESSNALFYHLAKTKSAQAEVWISAIEHPCVREAASHYFGNRCRSIPVNREGVVNLEWLTSELPDRRPVLVAIMAANNETGVLQPWRESLAI